MVEFYVLKRKTIGDLRSYMDQKWHNIDEAKLDATTIYRNIVELSFPIIYTTNYDNWIERAFTHFGKEYYKIVGVKDFIDIKDDVTQIVKFHGDFSDDSSINTLLIIT